MTMQDAPAAPARLVFGAAFSTTFGTVFGRLWSLFKAALLPLALAILLAVLDTLAALLWVAPDIPTQPGDVDWMTVAINAAPMAVFGLLAEFLSFLLLIVAIAAAYAQLSGWGGPREETLERFE